MENNKTKIVEEFYTTIVEVAFSSKSQLEIESGIKSAIKQFNLDTDFSGICLTDGEYELITDYENTILNTEHTDNRLAILKARIKFIRNSELNKLQAYINQNSTPEIEEICQNLELPDEYSYKYPDILD